VSVETSEADGGKHFSLAVNGKPDASTHRDVSTQLLLGHIPMMLKPEAHQVLVVGLGSGMTCGAVMRHPNVDRLDVVEISPEVAQAARLFAAHNDRVLENPKVHATQEDAKTFLQVCDRKYDAIISEPSNPWMAGVAGVFTVEYYSTCRARLQPGGLMVQWVQEYETDNRTLEVVLRTFGSVFPYFSVWVTADADLALVGSTRPQSLDLEAMQKRFQLPSVKASFERMDLFRFPVFLACEIISPDNAPYVASPDTLIHSDTYPVLESMAQRAFFAGGVTSLPLTYDENFSTRPTTILGHYLRDHPLTEDDLRAFSLFKVTSHVPNDRLYRSVLMRWMQDHPQSATPIELSAKSKDRGIPEALEAQQMQSKRQLIWDQAEKNPELLRYYAHYQLTTYMLSRSVFYQPPSEDIESVLKRLIEVDPANQRIYRLQLAELAWDQRNDEACILLARDALNPSTNTFGPNKFDLDRAASRRVLARMIETMWRAGDPDEAWAICQEAKKQGYVEPDDDLLEPLLLLAYRKVESFINQNRPAPIQLIPGEKDANGKLPPSAPAASPP